MAGIDGLGTRALTGQPETSDAAAWAAKYDSLGLKVTPANVLAIYSVVAEEVTRLRSSVANFRDNHDGGTMPPLGEDPVSPHAATGFSDATQQLLAKCKTEINNLDRVAQQLADAARAYGRSEIEIKTAFDPSKFVYKPAPLPQPRPQAPPVATGPAPAPPMPAVIPNEIFPKGMR